MQSTKNEDHAQLSDRFNYQIFIKSFFIDECQKILPDDRRVFIADMSTTPNKSISQQTLEIRLCISKWILFTRMKTFTFSISHRKQPTFVSNVYYRSYTNKHSR